MSDNPQNLGGYVCAPYLHDHDSIKLKDDWVSSKNIESLYFVTATFSEDSKPYFSTSSNHYILAKFKDAEKISKEIASQNNDKPSFLFKIDDTIFERPLTEKTNFVIFVKLFVASMVFYIQLLYRYVLSKVIIF